MPFSSKLTVPMSENGESQHNRSLWVHAQIMLDDVRMQTCLFGSDSDRMDEWSSGIEESN
jgi:hypothetical protein